MTTLPARFLDPGILVVALTVGVVREDGTTTAEMYHVTPQQLADVFAILAGREPDASLLVPTADAADAAEGWATWPGGASHD